MFRTQNANMFRTQNANIDSFTTN